MIRVFDYPRQRAEIEERFTRFARPDATVMRNVERIIDAVRRRGDAALLEYTERFDGVLLRPEQLRIPARRLDQAWRAISRELREALTLARERIRRFHLRQVRCSWTLREPRSGGSLTERIAPLQRVGIYVPGGRAPYPSTLLMNAIPAQVAGVPHIVMVTPPNPERTFNEATFAAAHLLDIKDIYQVGGAQAIAALAFGTRSIPKVDNVVGPGNIYVQMAKKLLFGTIDIDAIAGPSEIMILADETAPPQYVAADLLSQAEHDVDAVALAVLIGRYDIEALLKEISRQVRRAPRRAIIRASLRRKGMIIRTARASDAVRLANLKAPEHLEIMTREPAKIAHQVRNAGAIFLGPWSPEPIGDYVAGPNHVLPTDGSARFFSPLSVNDFLKTSNVLAFSRKGFEKIADAAIRIAEAEGFDAHAHSVRVRLGRDAHIR
jgi:histidinol dehydrogenase